MLLRDIIESLGKQTLMHKPGQPSQVLSAMESAKNYGSLLILSGHGVDGGFYLGDFADYIDVSVLRNGILTDSVIETLSIGPVDVISTCCETGRACMAEAFQNAGARTYLAPPNWSEGALVPLFLHIFFKETIFRNQEKSVAVELANAVFDDRDECFRLFDFS